ncbi:TadE/TadG family type IV pilus assembly protein [Massilia sp. 9I]|uniref:TadE/TadG family type IV pilus assembly protein n=1 Tax=Massilia sp. 9I TaxID=2653152 RepID=UPI00135CE80F|nr:TadE/TadG family type IV pilus assembly protein [Massilia sp. 9I]
MRKRLLTRSSATRGSVAIEFAFVLPILLLLLSTLVFFGRIVWHYTVAEKAAQDAVKFLARVSTEEIRAPMNGFEIPVAGLARSIVLDEVAELSPGDSPPSVNVLCDGIFCDGFSTPRQISVVVRVNMTDPFLSSFLTQWGLPSEILLTATSSTNYVGG